VVIEPIAPNGFRVSTCDPFQLSAEGATPKEALQKLRELLQSRVAGGAKPMLLEVGPFPHPWDRFVGKWTDDDLLIAEWEKEVEAYRQEVDEDPNIA
jgi:hypothetical protein